MEFLAGVFACWLLLATAGWLALRYDWYEDERFWKILCLPVIPLLWIWLRIKCFFRQDGDPA